ncbi:TatD family hydrolase [Kocuria sp.]|uniref:TatD family hydrolase n=1 Tax=Kocuria sp. TaxID=1871328 RepID=UPI0026DBC11E|nr:TatD family hydrolase [Kocuria sp.]MDO4919623.1 TatD family hydrolase [Kocuria sp.]
MIETPLSESLWNPGERPEPVVGETPAAYRPEEYALAADAPNGEGTERRAATDVHGQRRNLVFPPLPEPLPSPVVDNHTHLDMQDGLVRVSVADAVATAADASVTGLVQAGCDVESSRFAVAAAQAVPGVLAAVALHPNEAPVLAAAGQLDDALAAIAALAGEDRVRAVGETGMDRVQTPEEGLAAQEESFRAHIRMAEEHGLAMQIHDREAHEDVLRILRDEGAPERTVFHCFSGDPELARVCNENGWYMSFAGTVTFKNAKALQEALRVADPALVLCETDAPFLTPHPFRGRPNAPYMVNHTVRAMAGILDTDLDVLCRRIRENSRAVYGEF